MANYAPKTTQVQAFLWDGTQAGADTIAASAQITDADRHPEGVPSHAKSYTVTADRFYFPWVCGTGIPPEAPWLNDRRQYVEAGDYVVLHSSGYLEGLTAAELSDKYEAV